MKKQNLFVLILCPLILLGFAACANDLAVPETISVKTKADYVFKFGSLKKSLADSLDLNSMVGDSNSNADSSDVKISVDSYKPAEELDNSPRAKRFLLSMDLQEIPLDFAEFFNHSDIAGQFSSMSFPEKTITVPKIDISYSQEIPFTSYGPSVFNIPVEIKNTEEDPSVLSCRIAEGDLIISVPGCTVLYVKSTGGLEWNGSKTPNSEGKISLAGVTYLPQTIELNITVKKPSATEDMTSTNAEVRTDVRKISSMKVDMSDVTQTITPSETRLSEGLLKNVKSITFSKTGLKAEFINTFPAGNDLRLALSSNFLGISQQTKSFAGGNPNLQTVDYSGYNQNSTNSTVLLAKDPDNPGVGERADLDFPGTLLFPGQTQPSDPVVFSNVIPGEEYKLSLELKPIIEWSKIALRATSSSDPVKDSVPLNINISEMFSSLNEGLGVDLNSKMEFSSIPIYLYYSYPESVLSGFEMKAVDISTVVKIEDVNGNWIDDPNESCSSRLVKAPPETLINKAAPKLEKDEKGNVTSVFSEDSCTKYGNIKDSVNATLADSSKKLYFDYEFYSNVADGTEITSEDLDAIKNTSETPSIKISAYIILPLKMNVKDGGFELDLSNTIGASDEDILGRSGPTSDEDITKYLNAIESAGVNFSMKSMPINTENKNGLLLTIDLDGDGPAEPKVTSPSDGRLSVNPKTLFNTYPLTPTMKVKVPEGVFYIADNLEIDMSIALELKTDGTIQIK